MALEKNTDFHGIKDDRRGVDKGYLHFHRSYIFYIYFWRARVCRPLLRLCRPFMIFEGCLDSNPEYCISKLAQNRLSHPSLLHSHPSLLLSHPSLLLSHPSLFLYDLSDLSFFKFSIKITYGKVLFELYLVYLVSI
jgi:hypothetical protein